MYTKAKPAPSAKSQSFPIPLLREHLRLQALEQTQQLERNVGRRTSADSQPCLEYQEEVTAAYSRLDRILYLQHCRACLEQCIARGRSRLRYRWQDGHWSVTSFRRTGPHTVQLSGFLP